MNVQEGRITRLRVHATTLHGLLRRGLRTQASYGDLGLGLPVFASMRLRCMACFAEASGRRRPTGIWRVPGFSTIRRGRRHARGACGDSAAAVAAKVCRARTRGELLACIHPTEGGVDSGAPHRALTPIGLYASVQSNRPYRTAAQRALTGPSGAFRGWYAGVVTPRALRPGLGKVDVDSGAPHASSPLRGKHASRFVQSALPRRMRRALNGAVGGFARRLKIRLARGEFRVCTHTACGARAGAVGRFPTELEIGAWRRDTNDVSSGGTPDETCNPPRLWRAGYNPAEMAGCSRRDDSHGWNPWDTTPAYSPRNAPVWGCGLTPWVAALIRTQPPTQNHPGIPTACSPRPH